ncbi:MAG: SMC-Scp complex subunit ScpB [Synechococcales bacterium]|nr:SMC-Scp complex subunit ScpB [Synechococcales bacterium]
MSRLSCTIEAILYLKAQPIPLAEIAELAGGDRDQVEEALLELMADFAHRDTALEVTETPDGYCLQLRSDYQKLVQTIIPADIGVGALRTLAVIAMKGPILQTDLVNLRGSSAYPQVQELVEQGFVRKRRRSDGRSYWLQVTDKFHQYFQLDQFTGGMAAVAQNQRASKATIAPTPTDRRQPTPQLEETLPADLAEEFAEEGGDSASEDSTSGEAIVGLISDRTLDEVETEFALADEVDDQA